MLPAHRPMASSKKRNLSVHSGSLAATALVASPIDEPPFYYPPSPSAHHLQAHESAFFDDLNPDTAPFFNYNAAHFQLPHTVATQSLFPPLPFQPDYSTTPTVPLYHPATHFPSQMPVERPFSHTRSDIRPTIYDEKLAKVEPSAQDSWPNEKNAQSNPWNKATTPVSSAASEHDSRSATPVPSTSSEQPKVINPSLIGGPPPVSPEMSPESDSDQESRETTPVSPGPQHHRVPSSPTSSTSSRKARDPHRKQIEDRAANKRKSATNRFAKVLANRINSMPENGLANQLNMAAKLMESDGKRVLQLENDKRVLERKNHALESQVSKLKAKIYRLESRDDQMDAD